MKKWVFLLAVVLLAGFVNASFILHNFSVDRTYGGGETIRGLLNISFQNEPVNSVFKSNFLGEIKLIDFLDENSAYFDCIPENCDSGWVPSNPSKNKIFSLNSGREKILGLKIEGNFRELTALSFNISVNNSESCQNPLDIDFLDNGIDWKSTKTGTSYSCYVDSGTGCYDPTANQQEVLIGPTPYCEKIRLNTGSRFQLGAWVKRVGTLNPGQLKMYLYSLDNDLLRSCDLQTASESGAETYCNVSYFNPEIQDYYVCIKSDQASTHKTKKESSGEKCGFFSYPGDQIGYDDYYIFARSSRFTQIGAFNFNEQEYEKLNDGSLIDDLEAYISDNYDNECNPCILPIKFKANSNLDIRLENLNLEYLTYSAGLTSDLFYDASAFPSKINSSQLILDLELAGIKAPINYGNYDFYLYLNNNLIYSKPIIVVNNPIINRIYPLNQYALVNGKISANVSSPRNISSYNWDFGDGETQETTTNYVYYKYDEVGSYDLTLEIEDSSGYKTSKTVTISVSSPVTKANSTIQDYKKRLDNLSSELLNIGWYKDEISEILGLEDLISEVNRLERDYNAASSQEEYVGIMESLNALDIPKTIKKSTGEVPVLVSEETISSEAVSEILQDCGEACRKAIAAWDQNHLELNLGFGMIQAYYEGGVETILSSYTLEIIPDSQEEKELYLFLENSHIKDLDSREIFGFQVVSFDSIDSRVVEFTSELGFDELRIFLTPEFSLIDVDEQVICNNDGKCSGDESWQNCREDCKPWGWMVTLMIIVIAVALGAYLFLQWWYKEKYESSLFKNRNDLYNLLNFIGNGKSQGLNEREVSIKLKSQGWKSEQIAYAFKKFEGKAIMPLDFVKLFKKQKNVKR